jgi:hypothetical protein
MPKTRKPASSTPVSSVSEPLALTEADKITAAEDKSAATRGKGHRVRGGANASLQWAREQAAEALVRRQNKQEATVLQQVLPLWSEEHRGVPNPMIRSGLFGTKSAGNRVYFKGDFVASLSNFSILYKGEELLQDDLSVWMSLINMAREKRIGDAIFFSGYELVKDLGWRMHSDSYNRAKESISRLKANELKIQVKTGESGYAGSLIREYAWAAESPDGGAKWMVRFEPMIAELFREDNVTFIEWEQRKKIGTRATLTLWLHAYYMSHRDPFPITIQKLHELSKSEEKHLKSFKVRVRRSLETLLEIGALVSYRIEGDLVSVKKAVLRIPSAKAALTERLTDS